MKLIDILNDGNIKVIEIKGSKNREVADMQNDSRLINKKDTMFFAIKGYLKDGSKYISEAISRGANSIVIEKDCEIEDNIDIEQITIIRVENVREAMAYISKNFYEDPTNKIITIGVTGSKGKTSVTFILSKLLVALGYNVGLIGTIGSYINGKFFIETDRTSSESFYTNMIISKMIENGVDIVILEVSSQTLKTHRIDGMKFDYTCFTNFSEDHISETEHKDMEEYFNAKVDIASLGNRVILNDNDENVARAKKILEERGKDILTFGYTDKSDIIVDKESIKYDKDGTEFTLVLNGIKKTYMTNLLGEINVENIACAITIASCFDLDTYMIEGEIKNIQIPSRFEFIENKLGINVVIDYAHTEESLKQALNVLKNITKGKLITLWGLSGERDPHKRPLMGKVSGVFADYTILTSEDPRFEEPKKIAKEIAARY